MAGCLPGCGCVPCSAAGSCLLRGWSLPIDVRGTHARPPMCCPGASLVLLAAAGSVKDRVALEIIQVHQPGGRRRRRRREEEGDWWQLCHYT